MDGHTVTRSKNALEALLGYTEIRCNGGAPMPLRTTLRLRGFEIADEPGRRRTVATRVNVARITLVADLVLTADYWPYSNDPELPPWFGETQAFDEADDVFVTTEPDVRFAGFAVPLATPNTRDRKLLINVGTEPFEVRNFRHENDASDYDDPGMVQGRNRVIGPGESCRLQWDPTGQRWLVNDGMYSGEYVIWDNELVTFDDEPVTHPYVAPED